MQRYLGLVINKTFQSALPRHADFLERSGIRLAPGLFEIDPDRSLTPTQQAREARRRAREVDVVFGPGPGTDAELFADPGRLRVVALASSGYESVDVEAATRSGIAVTHAPTELMADSVAELTWGLMIAAARKIPWTHGLLWSERRAERPIGGMLRGKTLGLVGLGRIGMAVARKAGGFNMRVLAWNRTWDDERTAFAEAHGVERAAFRQVLAESDFLSLHVRQTQETVRMIDGEALRLMKPTAFLINTARSDLVDPGALREALENDWIAGAALDTIADKGTDSPLIGLPNVVGTPHLGNMTIEATDDYVRAAIACAVDALRGRRPKFLVNPEVWQRHQTIDTPLSGTRDGVGS